MTSGGIPRVRLKDGVVVAQITRIAVAGCAEAKKTHKHEKDRNASHVHSKGRK